MRTFINAAILARNVADAATGTALATIAAPAVETPAFNAADTSKSNVATIAVPKRKRTIGGAATAKPAAIVETPAADKPRAAAFDLIGGSSYTGASPVFRGHTRKLSPIVLDRIPGTFTDRDLAALKALHKLHGAKQFTRRDGDAGVFSRLIGHGALTYVSGALDMHDCKFAITAKAIKTRLASV